MADCNGWKNRATWNVALWVANDEPLYRAAVEYATTRKGRGMKWDAFVWFAGLEGCRTPDGFSFTGRDLDRPALVGMLRELATD